MSPLTLALRYVVFALVATASNLATQRLVLGLDDDQVAYYPALLAGTSVGLVIKYLLDKRWIFADPARGLVAHGRRFTLYTLMGVVTTVIFWGTETLFWLSWQTQTAREIGAILGLSIGYFVKYHLDRRHVFTGGAGAGHAT
ncbi:GtrA family protein [Novosphingobium sp. PS1R-30]|uniref:GtrA family protein n=1 Tax=Novosphingobium anseongense TaxID=3133436 RepID=A0ABU8RZ39_9SPHN